MAEEIESWKVAQDILRKHHYPSVQTSRSVILKDQNEFIEQGEKKVIAWNPKEYTIVPAGFQSADIVEKEVIVHKAVKDEEHKEVDPDEAARIRFEQMRQELQNVDLGEDEE